MVEIEPTDIVRFEYYMASLLLSGELDKFISELPKYRRYGYKKLPKHWSEAAIYHTYTNRLDTKQLETLGVNKIDIDKFIDYSKLLKSGDTRRLESRYQNTYWYYLNYQFKEQV